MFYNQPEALQGKLTPDEMERLKALAGRLGYRGVLDEACLLSAGDRRDRHGLGERLVDALAQIVDAVAERYGLPEFRGEGFIQVPLDQRFFIGRDGLTGAEVYMAAIRAINRGEPIGAVTLPGPGRESDRLVLPPLGLKTPGKALIARAGDGILLGDWRDDMTGVHALMLRIGETEVRVEGVVVMRGEMRDPATVRCVLGVDFGLVNSATVARVDLDGALGEQSVARLREAIGWTRDEVRRFFESHACDAEATKFLRFSGRAFLDGVAGHCKRIDVLKREVDRCYGRLFRLKAAICARFSADPEATFFERDVALGDDIADELLGRFWRLLDGIGKLKVKARAIWRQIGGLKKSWFGFIAGRIAQLAVQLEALVVHEALTFVAVPKDDPAYKGRSFNKALNNGARGQYSRAVTNRLAWAGIPLLEVPSAHSSTTDIRYGVVDKGQRLGERFRSRVDGRVWHADEHAALTLACFPILKEIPHLKFSNSRICDKNFQGRQEGLSSRPLAPEEALLL